MITTVEFTVTRIFDAPVSRVWKVETEPEYFAQWFGAKAGSVAMDVRTGGSWRAVVAAPDGSEFPLSGRYVDVVEHERLVLTIPTPDGEAEATVTFADLGDRTEVSFTCGAKEDAREAARAGTESIFDTFEDILTSM